ncbi:universal stress protein [bacterium]|nr:MAG: universal stress protein [bacterium]
MKTISNILVPTDFSKGSEIAYRYANDLALKFGGKVDLLHVIPAFRYLSESIKQLGLPFDMDKQVYPHLQKDAKIKLEQAMAHQFDDAVRGNTFSMIERKVDEAIIEKAKQGAYDLVLIGAQGANENQLVHGTITERVIRFSSVPVLTVPPEIPKHPVRKLLVPTDGSKTSLASLPYAIFMVDSLGGELTLLHVLEMFGTEAENETRDKNKDELTSIRDVILKKTEEYLAKNSKISCKIRRESLELYDTLIVQHGSESKEYKLYTKVVKGVSSHFEIVDYANDHADMIVMTTHGRSGLEHLLLGSTTETVVRHAKRPVLTYKPNF